MLLVSPRKELVHTSGVPDFVAAAQGMPLDYLALVASRAYIHRLYRTVANGENVHNKLHPAPPNLGHNGEVAD